jgi:hypothetical protein
MSHNPDAFEDADHSWSVGVRAGRRRVGPESASRARVRRPLNRSAQKCRRLGALDDHEWFSVLNRYICKFLVPSPDLNLSDGHARRVIGCKEHRSAARSPRHGGPRRKLTPHHVHPSGPSIDHIKSSTLIGGAESFSGGDDSDVAAVGTQANGVRLKDIAQLRRRDRVIGPVHDREMRRRADAFTPSDVTTRGVANETRLASNRRVNASRSIFHRPIPALDWNASPPGIPTIGTPLEGGGPGSVRSTAPVTVTSRKVGVPSPMPPPG